MTSSSSRIELLKRIERGQLPASEGVSALTQMLNQSEPGTVCCQSQWLPMELVGGEEFAGLVLLFDRDEALQEALAARLGSDRVWLVVPGPEFAKPGAHTYMIRPGSAGDHRRLMQEVAAGAARPLHVIHGWSQAEPESLLQTWHRSLEHSLLSMFHVAAALQEQRLNEQVCLTYVHRTAGGEANPVYAAVAGFLRTVRLEQPRLSVRTLELTGDEHRVELGRLLLREAGAGELPDTEVRYENGQRYVRRLAEVELPGQGGPAFKQKGTYLITGGLGGVGALVARHLACTCQANLVLVGRSAPEGAKAAAIRALEELGSNVLYLRADLARSEEAEALVRQVQTRFGRLDGVFHAAGVLRDSLLIHKTQQELEAVLAPKVAGTLHLYQACQSLQPDFMLLFSSTAAVTGSAGQSDYAYANSFLDHFAAWCTRRRSTTKTLSINWPLWLEGGMKPEPQVLEILRERFGFRPMESDAGLRRLADGLAFGGPQLTIFAGDRKRIRQMLLGPGPGAPVRAAATAIADAPTAVLDGGQRMQLRQAVETYLRSLLSGALKLPVQKIDAQEPFEQYGVDSLIIMELTRQLEEVFGDLSKTLFFEYRNLAELAEYFVGAHEARALAKFGRPAAPQAPVRSAAQEPVRVSPRAPVGRGVSARTEAAADEAIAIIGVSGRYPRARNLDEFWQHLRDGRDCISEVPYDRWDYRKYYDPTRSVPARSYTKWGGFVDDIDKFDPLFFAISPRESDYLDPQERLFLETVWETIEDAGVTRERLKHSRAAVFVGVMYGHYQMIGLDEALDGMNAVPSATYASIANRVSYFFNLNGPSMAIDTMCSSSLTAIHLACDSLRKGESDVAIAGGVNLNTHPIKHLILSQGRYITSGRENRSFADGADGFVPGEGVGAVLLKPLKKAVEDGDRIYAVIRGTALNHGGKVNGYSVPNPNAQGEVIREALRKANIDPRTISYVEAHGTGTALGDPIEITGLTKAFQEAALARQSIPIGSVKTNIGHLESAAGIAAVTKVLLQMKHGQLAPSIHVKPPNPHINFKDSPFYVQTKLAEWNRPVLNENGEEKVLPRRAGVSSFGAGGANAHIVLEEYLPQPLLPETVLPDGPQLIVLSARNEERLRIHAGNLAAFLRKEGSAATATPSGERAPAARPNLQQVTALVAEVLGVEAGDIQPDDALTDMGVDPLHLTELADRLTSEFRLSVTAGLLAESASLRHLVQTWAETASSPEVKPVQTLRLADIAYTLQVGREEMEERLALLVSSCEELSDRLTQFAQNKLPRETEFVYHDNKNRSEGLRDLVGGDAGEAFLDILLQTRDLTRLARLWAAGVRVNWSSLYTENRPRILSLPHYPFKRERHWVPSNRPAGRQSSGSLHPLIDGLDPERSLKEGVVFRKRIAQTDLIVDHHRVREMAVLPGVGYLEMALAAATGVSASTGYRLTGVVWLQPLTVEGEFTDVFVHIKEEQGNMVFEVRSVANDQERLHAKGEFRPVTDQAQAPGRVELDSIKARLRAVTEIDPASMYQLFRQGSVAYGPYFQGVQRLWVGEEEALSAVRLAPEYERELSAYTLHPALLDGALQSIIGLKLNHEQQLAQPMLPFAVGSVEVLSPLKAQVYAYVKKAGTNSFHIALLDESGTVCVKLRDVALRALKTPVEPFEYTAIWEASPLAQDPEQAALAQPAGNQVVLLVTGAQPGALEAALAASHQGADLYELRLGRENRAHTERCFEVSADDQRSFAEQLRLLPVPDVVYYLAGIEAGPIDATDLQAFDASQERGIISLYRLVQHLIKQGLTDRKLTLKVVTANVHAVVPGEAVSPQGGSLHGFVMAMVKEFPDLRISCLDVSLHGSDPKSTVQAIVAEPADTNGIVVAIRSGRRYIRKVLPLALPEVSQTQFRHQGVYLILGGAGGIGLELSKYLAEKVQARLVLIGRSPLDEQRMEQIRTIERKGGQVLYLQADATDPVSMQQAVDQARSRFGRIHGAIHSAIVLRDRTILRMDEETLRQTLAPKVRGSLVLHRVLQGEPLDFMLFFSSANSFAAGPGQSNYSAGCTFKDAFALWLSQQMPYPVKVINWGYWGSVGVVASEEYNKRMASMGVLSIRPEEGMRVIERVLAGPVLQVIPYKAEERLLRLLGVGTDRQVTAYPATVPPLLDTAVHGVMPKFEDDGLVSDKKRGLKQLGRFGQLLLLSAFQKMGVFRRGGEEYDREELRERLGIIPEYRRMFDALLTMVVNAGWAVARGNRLVAHKKLDRADVKSRLANMESAKAELLRTVPDMEPYVTLGWVCVNAYPEVLTGRRNHMEVMFPNGSKHLVENIYKGNKLPDYYNTLVANIVARYVEQRLKADPQASIRVLEVGAGTGGTSAFVLKALQPYGQNLRYFYTDISVGFTQHGQRVFGPDHGYAQFKVLDIAKDPAEQGFEPDGIDILFATNVLHATKEIARTLSNAKRLLKTNGLIVINEVTAVQDFITLTFGLTSGWWLYEDEALRLPGSPLLSTQTWTQVLRELGFDDVRVFGHTQELEESEQHVIVAASNGQVVAPLVQAERRPAGTGGALRLSARPKGPEASLPERTPTAVKAPGLTGPDFIAGHLKRLFSEVLKLNEADLDARTEFGQYGVDSLVVLEINKRLEAQFGPLPATVLFDHPTLEKLTGYILQHHAGEAQQLVRQTPVAAPELPGAGRPEPADLLFESEAALAAEAPVPEAGLAEGVESYLTRVVAGVLKMDPRDLDTRTEFGQYGVDSLVIMEVTKRLEQDLGPLPPTLLFDYPTIAKLSEYVQARTGQIHQRHELEAAVALETTQPQTAQAAGSLTLLREIALPFDVDAADWWKHLRDGKVTATPTPLGIEPMKRALSRGKLLHLLVTTPGARNMEVLVAGTGRPLLLIPGFGFTAPVWMHQINAWAPHYQVIVVHSPGFGLSEGSDDVSLNGIGRAYHEVLEVLGVQWPLQVVGTSWGGLVAQTLATQYPDQIASIVLAASFASTKDVLNGSMKDKVREDFAAVNAAEAYSLVERWEYSNGSALAYANVADGGHSTADLLPLIQTPTLIVAGSKDSVVNPAESQRLHERIRTSEYQVIEGAGHAPNFTHYAVFNQAVEAFFKRRTEAR
jgi:acyl transferase domain-containing protein/pimeloyl-ACP methyl ester carboxylesterase/SAM-dependent methyltransferase